MTAAHKVNAEIEPIAKKQQNLTSHRWYTFFRSRKIHFWEWISTIF